MTGKKLVGCLTLMVFLCSASVGNAGLVGHWSFDEADGTTAAESVSGHDATLVGDAVFAPGEGRFGGALLLPNDINPDLRTSRAEFAFDEVFDTETYSISIWAKTAQDVNGHFGLGGNRPVAGGPGRGWASEVSPYNGNNTLRALIPIGDNWHDVRTDSKVTVGEWSMITWTVDGATREVNAYNNDTLVSSTTAGGSAPLFPQGQFWIGGTGANGKELFVGMLDDMGIWNHVLTPEDLAEVYATGVPEPSTVVMLLGCAVVGIGVRTWRKRRR